MKTPAPDVSVALVQYLDKAFPFQPPNLGDPVEKVWRAAGAREVVNALRAICGRQHNIEWETNLVPRRQSVPTKATDSSASSAGS